MDDFDTLVSRIEHVDLPVGTRAVHLDRITQALHQGHLGGAPAGGPDADGPAGRRRTVPAAVLVGAAVVAIVTGAWFLFTPAGPAATTAPMASPTSSASTQATAAAQPLDPEPGPLTAPGAATELAGLLHITPTAAQPGLTRLAALADQNDGRLDPTTAQFGAIATDLGVTPDALEAALTQLKTSYAADHPATGAKPAGTFDSTKPETQAPGPAGADLLTTPATATEFAGLLHISSTAAKAGLNRLATLADQTGGRLDPKTTQFRDIAADLGTTPSALDAALVQIKAAAAAHYPATKAKTAGGPAGKASGTAPADSDALTDPATATQLAATLHVTPAAARTALTRLAALSKQHHGLNPTATAFRDIATDLGATPAGLTHALREIKAGG